MSPAGVHLSIFCATCACQGELHGECYCTRTANVHLSVAGGTCMAGWDMRQSATSGRSGTAGVHLTGQPD
jgi:hypothetical protein